LYLKFMKYLKNSILFPFSAISHSSFIPPTSIQPYSRKVILSCRFKTKGIDPLPISKRGIRPYEQF
jgi:hypothetical protein